MGLFFGGSGVIPDLKGNVTNIIQLQPGGVYPLPNDWFEVDSGKYSVIQEFDPIAQFWRTVGAGTSVGNMKRIKGDGNNYRLANQSGCAVGALVTTAGSAYTSAPTVAVSAGGSIWRAIIGGAVNTSVTVSNGGTNYTYPPLVLIAAPPAGGIQASGYCTLTSNAVSSVTITDQGAGYSAPPTIIFQNDPREGQNGVTLGSGATAIATLTGAGTLTGLICIDHGSPLTSVPTLTFSGGGGSSAAATVIMNFAATAYAVTSGGTVYSGVVNVTAIDNFPSTTPAYTNVTTQKNLVRTRQASIIAALSAGVVTATGQTVLDGGVYTSVPNALVLATTPPATAAALTISVGGQQDTCHVLTT